MEKLSDLINSAMEANQWKFISSKAGPSASHIFFADELILFAEVSMLAKAS